MRSLTEGLEERPATGKKASRESGGLREAMNNAASGPAGKAVLVVIALAMVGFLGMRFMGALGPNPATVLDSRARVMDPRTGELKWHKITLNSRVPEGFYPVEYCWNDHAEGGIPTIPLVLLFPSGDPRHELPTVCPCCGETVRGRNPKPEEFADVEPKDYETGRASGCVTEYYRGLLAGG